jgi:hypothetical protein
MLGKLDMKREGFLLNGIENLHDLFWSGHVPDWIGCWWGMNKGLGLGARDQGSGTI